MKIIVIEISSTWWTCLTSLRLFRRWKNPFNAWRRFVVEQRQTQEQKLDPAVCQTTTRFGSNFMSMFSICWCQWDASAWNSVRWESVQPDWSIYRHLGHFLSLWWIFGPIFDNFISHDSLFSKNCTDDFWGNFLWTLYDILLKLLVTLVHLVGMNNVVSF